jgi:hypothetical protein
MILMNQHKQATRGSFAGHYRRPMMTHKGKLAQFAGSPLKKILGNPLDLPEK